MNIDRNLPPLALIAGPTASGKSALALGLAERIGGTIVNADASQVYRDLRILSARPSLDEEARAPHRLFGHVDGAIAYNAAAWAAEAKAAIADIHATGGVAILVGGTGLYIRTLLDGIAPVPPIDPGIRAAVRALPVADAHAALAREDPAAAVRLAPGDTTRVARALEVMRSSGRTLAAWQCERVGGIAGTIRLVPAILLPDVAALAERIDRRFLAMIETGAIGEIDALAARGLDPALPVMRAIGVPDLIAWRHGTIERDTAIASAQAASRRYAKRQRTWFRNQLPVHWRRMNFSDDADHDDAMLYLETALTR